MVENMVPGESNDFFLALEYTVYYCKLNCPRPLKFHKYGSKIKKMLRGPKALWILLEDGKLYRNKSYHSSNYLDYAIGHSYIKNKTLCLSGKKIQDITADRVVGGYYFISEGQLFRLQNNRLTFLGGSTIGAWVLPDGQLLRKDVNNVFHLRGNSVHGYTNATVSENNWLLWSEDGRIGGGIDYDLGYNVDAVSMSNNSRWLVTFSRERGLDYLCIS